MVRISEHHNVFLTTKHYARTLKVPGQWPGIKDIQAVRIAGRVPKKKSSNTEHRYHPSRFRELCGELPIGTNGMQWYERSGQICNIWFRGTKCLANTGLSQENFLYTHNTYLHPDLLQSSPKVQLMGMTSKEVCFSIPNNHIRPSSGNMG